MVSVLINAYACAPNKGSEPGMAWNWVINLANYCELHVITEGEWQKEIESALENLPQKGNLHFYYNPVSEKVRTMCWNQGDWRFYYYYQQWQKKTLRIAKSVIAENHIDIVHQLNMIGFREPGYLWKIEDKPFIWGPVDAKESFPVAYLQGTGFKSIMKMYLKNYITKFQLIASSRLRRAAMKSSSIISASSESVQTFKKYFDIDSVLINETGCYVNQNPILKNVIYKTRLDLLWVGKFDFRKQLELALKVIAQLNNDLDICLHIAGGTEQQEQKYKVISNALGIREKCKWYGIVSHNMIQDLMQSSDLLFFTSVSEGTPHVVLEAIGNNLPVLCFDCCGQGDSVNDKVGLKIPLSNTLQAVVDFEDNIKSIYSNRKLLKQMSENCNERQKILSWEGKVKEMEGLYIKAIQNNKV